VLDLRHVDAAFQMASRLERSFKDLGIDRIAWVARWVGTWQKSYPAEKGTGEKRGYAL